MKRTKRILAALLALCLLLALTACTGDGEKQSAASSPTAQSEAAEEPPRTEEPEPEPEPQPQPEELYLAAADELTSSEAFELTISSFIKHVSSTGGSYTDRLSGKAQYLRYGQKDMTAVISGTLVPDNNAYGYTYVFHNGVEYRTIKKANYFSPATAEEFLARQIPAVLFDTARYSTITQTEENGQIRITFSDAVAGESWAMPAGAELVEASGTAVLSAEGVPVFQKYEITYRLRGSECQGEYRLDAAVTETPDLSDKLPANRREYESLDSIDAPELLLRALGTLQAADVLYYSEQFTPYIASTGIIVTSNGETYLYNVDGTVGGLAYADTLSYLGEDDYTEVELTFTLKDGVLTTDQNGNVTELEIKGPSQMASVLPTFTDGATMLFPTYDSLTDCAVVDLGDYYLMEFTGSPSFSLQAQRLISTVYYGYNEGLRDHSSAMTTLSCSGYLGLEKGTLMPTAYYLSYSGYCVIDGTQIPIALERSICYAAYAPDTYETIFGEPEPTDDEPITPLLYEVTDGQGGKLYLFGTIHAGDTRMAHLPETVTDALFSSDELAVEFDDEAYYDMLAEDEGLIEDFQKAYFYLDGSTISNHVDSDLYRAALPMMLVTGSYSTLVEYMKPTLWAQEIESFLLKTSGTLCSSYGADYTLMALARDNGIPIVGAESDHEHATLLGRYSDGVQEMLLASAVSISRAEYLAEIESFYELWCSGDEDAIRAYLRQDETPEDLTAEELALYEEYVNSLETQRNAQMIEACRGYLGSGKTVLCAVGIAHLLGEGGLVDQLRAAGYAVEIVR